MMEIFPSMYFSDNFFVYWKKSEKSVPPIFFLVAKDVAVLVVGKKNRSFKPFDCHHVRVKFSLCSVNATSVYENYGLLFPIIEVDNHFSSFNIG